MESILARALEYTLKYWLKSFSRDQFKLQGRTVQLSNLGIYFLLDCVFLLLIYATEFRGMDGRSLRQFFLKFFCGILVFLDIDGDALHASVGFPPALNVTTAKVGKLEIIVSYFFTLLMPFLFLSWHLQKANVKSQEIKVVLKRDYSQHFTCKRAFFTMMSIKWFA